ncbi:tetratricopeptide repeat protein [candidate division KSB1 bacterium]|nr:tetratricopeptide repeat protein [candidate division KSB1 bacterium]
MMKRIILLFLGAFWCFLSSCGQIEQTLNQAIKQAQQGDFEKSIESYQKIVVMKPHDPFLLNNYGWTLFKSDSLITAKTILTKSLSNTNSSSLKKNVETNLFMVNSFLEARKKFEQHKIEDALVKFQAITRQYNLKEVGFKYLALSNEAVNKAEEAKIYWQKIVSLYAGSPIRNHFYLLARQKLNKIGYKTINDGNYQEAIRIYRLISDVEKKSACQINFLAYAFFRNDELLAAQRYLEKAKNFARVKSECDSIETNLFIVTTFLAGEYSLRQENFQEALTEFQKFTKRYPETDIGLYYLGLCYEGLKDKKTADEIWQRIAFLHEGKNFKNKDYLAAISKLKLEPE